LNVLEHTSVGLLCVLAVVDLDDDMRRLQEHDLAK